MLQHSQQNNKFRKKKKKSEAGQDGEGGVVRVCLRLLNSIISIGRNQCHEKSTAGIKVARKSTEDIRQMR